MLDIFPSGRGTFGYLAAAQGGPAWEPGRRYAPPSRIALGGPVTRAWREPTGLAHTLQDDRYLLAKWVVIIPRLLSNL